MCQEKQVYIYIKPDNFNEIDLETRSLTILGGLSGWFSINLTDAKKIYSKIYTYLEEGKSGGIIRANLIDNTLRSSPPLQEQLNEAILAAKSHSSINHIEFTSKRVKAPVIERRNERGQYLPRVIDNTIEIIIEYKTTAEKTQIKKINNKRIQRFNFNKQDVFDLLAFNLTDAKKAGLVDFSVNKNKVDVNKFKEKLSGPNAKIKFGFDGISEDIIDARERKGVSEYFWTANDVGYYFVGICNNETLFIFTCTEDALDGVKKSNQDRLKVNLTQKQGHNYEWQYQERVYEFQLRLSSSGSATKEVTIERRDHTYPY